MRLACYGSRMGLDVPEWMLERAEYAQHYWTQIEEISGRLGFYDKPTDPLPRPTPENHRSEVFENELDYMTPVAAELVTELLGADVYVTEMPYGNNFRTDLAICEIDRDALRKRLTLTDGDDRSLADEWKFIKTYRYLRNAEPMTYEEFVERGPYSSSTTNRKVWNHLEDIGLLTTKGGYATILNAPDHITAHAVELKQRDWETAYEQAQRAARPHRHTDDWQVTQNPKKYGYADYCWVVLDAGHIDKALEHREKFENGNVGLIGLDEGGAVKLIDASGSSSPKRSMDREHLNEKTMQELDVDDHVDRSEISRQADLMEAISG